MPRIEYKNRKLNNNLSESHKKVWETRRKNGNDKQSYDSNKKRSESLKLAWKNKDKRNNILIGMKNSESCWKKGNIPWNKDMNYEKDLGKEKALEISNNISVGTKNAMKNPKIRKKVSQGVSKFLKEKPWDIRFGVERAKELKEKFSADFVKRATEAGINATPNIGKNETKLLNEQEKIDNCKIIRQYKIKISKNRFRSIDGYCKETNTAYEVYEKQHSKNIEEDLKRQKEIEEKLNCKFIIIWDEK